MKKLIVHIGMSKTGTSALQAGFARNQNRLLEEGWLYPESGRYSDQSHHDFAFALRGRQSESQSKLSVSELIENLVREVEEKQPQKGILISSEMFERIARFPEALDYFLLMEKKLGMKLEVIAFIRNQLDYIQSLYRQWIKDLATSENRSPSQFAEDVYKHIDYWPIFNIWKNRIGVQSLHVYKYEDWHQNLMAPFFDILDLNPELQINLEKRTNPSWDGETLKLAIMLRQMNLPKQDLEEAYQCLPIMTHQSERLSLIGNEIYQKLAMFYNKSNACGFKEFDLKCPFEFSESTYEASELSPNKSSINIFFSLLEERNLLTNFSRIWQKSFKAH